MCIIPRSKCHCVVCVVGYINNGGRLDLERFQKYLEALSQVSMLTTLCDINIAYMCSQNVLEKGYIVLILIKKNQM